MTAPVVAAPFLASAVVLVGAGAAKVMWPQDTARALQVAGWRVSANAVRAGAVVEMGIGLTACLVPGPVTGALVAASYLAFAGFVIVALQRGWPLSSCGCFGQADGRPSFVHAALNTAAAVIAVWWSVAAPSGLGSLVSGQPWHGVPLLLLVLVIAGLAYAVWTNPVGRAVT